MCIVKLISAPEGEEPRGQDTRRPAKMMQVEMKKAGDLLW